MLSSSFRALHCTPLHAQVYTLWHHRRVALVMPCVLAKSLRYGWQHVSRGCGRLSVSPFIPSFFIFVFGVLRASLSPFTVVILYAIDTLDHRVHTCTITRRECSVPQPSPHPPHAPVSNSKLFPEISSPLYLMGTQNFVVNQRNSAPTYLLSTQNFMFQRKEFLASTLSFMRNSTFRVFANIIILLYS